MLTEIEDLLLARAQAVLGAAVRNYLPLPGGLGQLAALLGAQSLTPPVVFATWLGTQRPAGRMDGGRLVGPAGLQVVSTWALLAVTQHPAGALPRPLLSADAITGPVVAGTLPAGTRLSLTASQIYLESAP